MGYIDSSERFKHLLIVKFTLLVLIVTLGMWWQILF